MKKILNPSINQTIYAKKFFLSMYSDTCIWKANILMFNNSRMWTGNNKIAYNSANKKTVIIQILLIFKSKNTQ